MTHTSIFTSFKSSISSFFVNFFILFLLLFLPFLSQTGAAQTQHSNNKEIESILHKHSEVIVRVYFDDADQARNFGLGLEPMESDYEKGYLVFHLGQEEYNKLSTALDGTGMSMALDSALTRQYITHFQPQLPQASSQDSPQDSSQRQLSQMTTFDFDVSNYEHIPNFECYRTVEGTYQTALDIVSEYPTLATWTDVGDSWEKVNLGPGAGYDMMVLKLTNEAIPGPKPKIFFTSSIHAREYTTAELMTRFAVKLVEDYGVDADTTWVLDHHEVHMMLSANPDGRKKAETSLLWRKNTNQNYACLRDNNLRGADLNRNFPFEWNCCNGSDDDTCGQTFHGASGASEPETQAIKLYLDGNFADRRGPGQNDAAPLDTMGLYIDVHSSGRLLLWPWGSRSTPTANGTQLQTLGRKLAYFNGHQPKQAIGLYATDGTTTSYSYGELGLASYTYELGTTFFQSCNYFNNTLLPDNLPSLAYLIKTARKPYVLPAGPDVINQTLSPSSPMGVPAGTPVRLSMTATDQRFNNSNGTEPSQNVVSAEYFLGAPPWSASPPVANQMLAVDGNPNSPVEEFEATIDTTGFSQGQHTIYIQSTDQNGTTGVVSAIFLEINDNAVLPETVFFDDFETDQGWQSNPLGTDTATTGQWERGVPQSTNINGNIQQLDTPVSGSFDLVTGRLAGTGVGSHDIDNGVTSIRSPVINLPTSSSITLSFHSYMAHYTNASSEDFFRASIVQGANSTVVFEELGDGLQDNALWQQQSIDLMAYSGQSIQILFEAADAGGGSLVEAAVDDVEITAVLANQPPVVVNPGNQSSKKGDSVNLPVQASDPDNDPLVYSAILPAGLTINIDTGDISGTVTADPGAYASSVTVADDQGNDDTESFTWTITNEPPEITNPGNQNNLEGDNAISVFIVANDVDNDPLTFSDVNSSLPPGLSIDPVSGEIAGALDFNSAGSYAVTVAVSDGNSNVTTSFNWNVNNVNRAPIITSSIGNQTNDEGNSINIVVLASDPDGDNLLYSASGVPSLPGGVSIDVNSGLLSGILSPNSAGIYTITVAVSDGDLSATQAFSWVVADVNLPPALTNPGNQTNQLSDNVNLPIQANDPEGDPLTYSVTGLPGDLSIDMGTGVISGTVNASVGVYQVTITVSDANNQDSETFNWTISQATGSQQTIYLSSNTGGSVGGVSFADEDILAFDIATSSWQMYLDGSDIGLNGSGSRDINAFTFMDDGSLIFSVLGATTLPDVGAVDDSDLIRFVPIAYGPSTSGSFEMYFDGSDVGLTQNGEDIDSVSLLADGRLLISTLGSYSVPGATGRDEDLTFFTPTNLGTSTTGSWSRYFDGSDVDLYNSGTEDIYAAWMDESSANGDLYLSTRGDFSVTGVSGNGADIFVCIPNTIGPSTNTDCEYSLFWDGDAFGYGTEVIDGMSIQ